MERVAILGGLLRLDSIWLNKQYMVYVKTNIGCRPDLKQKPGETNEDYYSRILTRHTYESNDEYEVREAFLRVHTQDLPIWKTFEYMKYITIENDITSRPQYVPNHLRMDGESKASYSRRLLTKRVYETSDNYESRKKKTKRALISTKNGRRNVKVPKIATEEILSLYYLLNITYVVKSLKL